LDTVEIVAIAAQRRIETLMKLLPSDLLVPKPLLGDYPKVRRVWSRVTNRAMRDGTWKHALADMDYLSLAESPEDIVMDNPGRYRGRGDAWQLCVVHDLLVRYDLGSPEERPLCVAPSIGKASSIHGLF
jgi:hypothetical protein